MNRIYSKVWNAALRQLVVASELAGRGGKGSVRGDASSMRRCLVGGLVLAIAMACAGTAAAQSTQDWKLQANGDTTTDVAAGDTVQFLDGANISITRNGTDITFSTVSTPSFQGADMGGQKVTGVAGGSVSSGSKDAVNGGQLYAVQTTATNALDVANQGWNLKINGDPAATVAPGDTVQFQQDGNIVITHNGNAVTVSMKATPNFTGADMGSAKVTHVAGGSVASNSKDAVNGGQLFAVKSTADTALSTANTASQGWKVQVNGQTAATIAPGDTLNFQQDGNILVTRSGTDITLSMKATPNFSGADMGGQKITHVGAGSATTDAVNVSQLNAVGGKADQLGSDVAQVLGGGATYDSTTGAISSPTYTITTASGTTQVDNVGDALNQMNGVGGSVASGIKYFHANSTLADSQAIGADSVAIGPETVADGDNGFAAGQAATIDQTSAGAVAIGDGATVGHDSGNTVAIGTNAKSTPASQTATVNDAVAIGHAAEVTDNDAVAVGHSAVASAGAVGIGQDATSTGGNTVAMGHGAQANMSEDIAIGLNAGNGSFSNTNTTSDIQNVYIGSSAGANVTNGGHNVAVGYQAGMDRGDNSDQNVAMGGQAGKGQSGRFNVAIGNQASSSDLVLAATGTTAETVAIGREAGAEADGAISIGSFTRALGTNATTVGYDAYARTAGSLALGSHADAVSAGSIALGANSLADSSYDNPSTGAYLTSETATHILSIGAPAGSPNSASGVTRRIANVAGGALDTDAVNVAQLKQLGTEVKGLFGADVSIDADGNMSFSRDGDGSLSAWLDAHTPGSGTGGTATNPVVYDGAAATSISLAGGASGTQIHNLAEGTSADDAVNKGQMDDAIDASKTHYFSVRPVSGTSNENNNKATGDDSLAVGQAGLAAGDNSVAVGRGTTAGDEKGDDGAIAMGHDATVNVAYGTAIGVGANAKVGAHATAIGHAARADGVSSVALGHDAQVEVTANPSADDGIAIGTDAYVNVDQGQAYGHQASAHDGAIRGVAIGDNAESVSASDAYAIGTRALANATSAHAVGTDSVADAQNAYAQGTTAAAHATDSQAFGTGATTGEYAARSIAFGSQANTGTGNPALVSTDNIAMGTHAKVAGDHSIAVGGGNTVGKQNGTGATATLSGNYSAAFGNDNTVNQDNTFVVGNGVTTTQANSVVLGNASTDRAATTETGAHLYGADRTFAGPGDESFGIVSVGAKGAERQIINVAAGNISATSTDAVNGSQLYQTNQAVDDFAGDMATYLGGGASHDPNGNVTQPTYNVLGTDYHNVGDAIAAATTHYYSVNDGGTQGGNYNDDGATGTNALAAGVDAKASEDDTIALGHAATASGQGAVALGDSASATGARAYAQGQGAKAVYDGDVAIGSGADTTTPNASSMTSTPANNTAIGLNAKAQGGGSLAMGYGSLATGTSTTGTNNAVALGSLSQALDYNTTAVGVSAVVNQGATSGVAVGSAAVVGPGSFGSVAVGSDASVGANASSATAIGSSAQANANGASALGSNAYASGAFGTAVGNDSHATDEWATAVGVGSHATGSKSIAMGRTAATGDDAVSIGTSTRDMTKPVGQQFTVGGAFGDRSIAIGKDVRAAGDYSLAMGNDGTTGADAEGANSIALGGASVAGTAGSGEAIAIGHGAQATGAQSIAIGTGNVVSGANSGAFGDPNTVSGTGSYALGNNNTIANDNTFVIGNGVTTTQDNSVVLGNGSTDGAVHAGTTATQVTLGGATYTYAGPASAAAGMVSVGSSGAERQIQNVAAGDVTATSTDAVNGSQLYATNQAIDAVGTVANAGWNVGVNGGTAAQVKPGDNVDFSNPASDGNLTIAKTDSGTDHGITIELADDISVDSVKAGNSKLDTSGLTVDDGAGNVTTTRATGTTVTDGTNTTTVAATGTTIDDGAGNTVTTTAAGTTMVDGTNTTTYGADGLAITGGPTISSAGIDAGSNKITNVADGTADSDAATVGQLNTAAAAATTHYYSVNDGGTQGDNYNNDGATGISALAAGVGASASGNNSVAIGADAFATGFQGIALGTVASATAERSIAIGTSSRGFGEGSVAIGYDARAHNANDVALGYRSHTAATVATSSVTINGVTYNFAGTTPGATVSVGSGVTFQAPATRTITNVAAGRVSATSTDAINGSELYATNQAVDVLGTQVDTNTTNIGDLQTTVAKPITFSGNDDTNGPVAAKLGDTVAITGTASTTGTYSGANVKTVTDSTTGSVDIQLADNPEFTSVKAGNSKLDTSGLTVDDGAGNVTTTGATGTTVTDGTKTTTVAATGTTIDDGAGNTVTTTAAGTTMADGTNTTTYGADGLAITGGPTISSAGIDAGDKKITNVKAGTIGAGSLDAINGSQLQAASDSLANDVLGGNATYDGTTNSYTMTDIGGTGKNNINDAIASANDAATAGWNVADGAGNSNNVGPNGKVTFNGDSNITVTESGADDAAKVTVALKDDISVDSVKAGDSTLDTNGLTVDDGAGNVATTGATGTTVTDASGNTTTVAATGTTIDDGAGNTVTTTAAGTTMTDGTNTTTYSADGLAITGGPTISSAGIDAGDKKITNVKAGTIGAGSLDAINGSQLQAAGDSLANDVLGGNATYDGTTNSYSMTNIGGTGKDNINDAIASANAAATAGWNLTAQGANSSNVGPNDAVDLNSSDGNIVVSKTAASNDVTFDLAKDIKVDSVSLGSDVKLDTTGLLIVGGPSITVAGIDAGNLKITHVAPGTDPTDAVNKSQLDHVSDQVQQLADNAVQYDDSSKGKVTLGGPASTDGGKTGGTTISNVHRGDVSANSTDAVNGSQLYETNQNVANNSDAIQNIQNGQGGYFQVKDSSGKGKPAASGKDSTAGGAGAVASGDRSTAVGSGAKATGKDSVALGEGSVASRDGAVSVGSDGHERQVTHVAPGTESTDAVNVGQLNGAVQTAKSWAKNYTDKRFDTVNRNINVLGHRVDAGVASAMAMASMPQAYAPNQSAAAVGLGQFHGEVGVAVGLSTITDSGRYVFKLNASGNTRGDVGVGVGAAVVW